MAEPTFEWVHIGVLHVNVWNPNQMDPEMFAKAVESIHQFGFVDPVTVREMYTVNPDLARASTAGYEIIDGEHRWKAGLEHSGDCERDGDGQYVRHVPMTKIPIVNLGRVEDEIAKQLTIVLNETRGTFDAKRMGQLLTELVAVKPLPELAAVLPFTKDRITELAELPKVDWEGIERKAPTGGRAEKWVERVYRLPAEAAQKLDEAIGAARDEPGSPDWRALQTIAENFLGA